jgi:hypothetical protein
MPLAPDTMATATEPAPMPMRRYGNGLYIGISAGPSIPVQSIDNAYSTGYTVDVPIGWDSPYSPLGFRLDLGYTRLGSRDSFRTGSTFFVNGTQQTATLATNSAQIWSALANAKLRLPFFGHFGGGATSGVYAVGGAGVNHFRNYNTTFALTNPEFNDNSAATSTRETLTRLALDAGGGISWGMGLAEVFLESRYVTALTANRRASYVPITLGITFR